MLPMLPTQHVACLLPTLLVADAANAVAVVTVVISSKGLLRLRLRMRMLLLRMLLLPMLPVIGDRLLSIFGHCILVFVSISIDIVCVQKREEFIIDLGAETQHSYFAADLVLRSYS